MSTTTTRGALRIGAGTDAADFPLWVGNLANDIDALLLIWLAGTTAAKPAAARDGRLYHETDGDRLSYDMGSSWRKIMMQIASGDYMADNPVNATAFKVAGTLLASTHLSDTALLARLAGPALTGVPTAPTAAVDTNTTQLATTAYVVGQGYAKLASPTLTGTPAAPTAGGGTNTTQIATTAFVQSAIGAISTVVPNDVLANRPAAGAGNNGKWYYSTDNDVLYFGTGGVWVRIGSKAGDIAWTMNTAAAPGRVLLDGASYLRTGIYADLFGIYSTTYGAADGTHFNVPNVQGFMPVIKGTHTDISTLGNNSGESTGNRRPRHAHTNGLTLPDHVHPLPMSTGGADSGTPGGDWVPGSGTNSDNPTTHPPITGTIGITGNTGDAPSYWTFNVEVKL